MRPNHAHVDYIDFKVSELADIGVFVPYEEFGAGVDMTVKSLIMDAFLSTVTGYKAIPQKELDGLNRLMKQDSGPCRPVLPLNVRTSAEMAGFMNGYSIRYGELGDSKRQKVSRGGHPSDMIAGMLAVCDQPGISGKHILEAINAGYKVWSILNHIMMYKRPEFDPVTLLGLTMPIVLGIGRGDDWSQIENSVRVSAVGAPVMMQVRAAKVATNMKSGAAGYALQRAIMCDRMSAVLECPDSIFTGVKGWAPMVAPFDKELADAVESDDEVYELIQLKALPCCNVNQAATESAIRLSPKLSDRLDSIKTIHIRVCAADAAIGMKKGQPRYPYDHPTADHHIQYCMAIGLKYGTFTPNHFKEEYMEDQDIRRLIDLTTVSQLTDEEHAQLGGFDGAGILEIELLDGTVLTDAAPHASGLFVGIKGEERAEKMRDAVGIKQKMLEDAFGYDFSKAAEVIYKLEIYSGRDLLDALQKTLGS